MNVMRQTPSKLVERLLMEETVVASREELAKQALTPEQQKCLAAEAKQWLKQGAAHQRQGNTVAALADFQKALQAFQTISQPRSEAKVVLVMAHLCYSLADYLWATDYARHGLELARQLADQSLQHQALSCLGNSYRHLGELDKAETCMAQSLGLAQATDNQEAEMRSLGNLALIYRVQGQSEKSGGPL